MEPVNPGRMRRFALQLAPALIFLTALLMIVGALKWVIPSLFDGVVEFVSLGTKFGAAAGLLPLGCAVVLALICAALIRVVPVNKNDKHGSKEDKFPYPRTIMLPLLQDLIYQRKVKANVRCPVLCEIIKSMADDKSAAEGFSRAICRNDRHSSKDDAPHPNHNPYHTFYSYMKHEVMRYRGESWCYILDTFEADVRDFSALVTATRYSGWALVAAGVVLPALGVALLASDGMPQGSVLKVHGLTWWNLIGAAFPLFAGIIFLVARRNFMYAVRRRRTEEVRNCVVAYVAALCSQIDRAGPVMAAGSNPSPEGPPAVCVLGSGTDDAGPPPPYVSPMSAPSTPPSRSATSRSMAHANDDQSTAREVDSDAAGRSNERDPGDRRRWLGAHKRVDLDQWLRKSK